MQNRNDAKDPRDDESREESWQSSWEGHRRQQIIDWARRTSPRQRLEWIESMLIFMASSGKPYLERKLLLSKMSFR